MRRDSVFGTFVVATILCVVCSVLVSSAAVGLRGIQNKNKELFQKKNILIASGVPEAEAKALSSDEVDERFQNIETLLIDLATGQPVEEGVVDANTYDQVKAAKEPDLSIAIDAEHDLADIKRREKYSRVYLVKEGDAVQQVVFPVYGKGLWSTLYGFVALQNDLNTVAGLTFYSHGETPGLGGEIDNPNWKAKWPGKKIFRDAAGDGGTAVIEVVKGQADPASDNAAHQIDGLSGATITSRGVSNLLRYWMSEHGFGPFLKNMNSSGGSNG